MWLYGACYTNNGRHPFHLYYFEVISGTKDEGPNLTTKGVSTALIQEITRILVALSHEQWMKTKYVSYYKSHYHTLLSHMVSEVCEFSIGSTVQFQIRVFHEDAVRMAVSAVDIRRVVWGWMFYFQDKSLVWSLVVQLSFSPHGLCKKTTRMSL